MTVGILGLGLIGGSLARAYAKAGWQVLACEQDEDMFAFAQVAEVVHGRLDASTAGMCDLILLAIYPDGCVRWLEAHAPVLSRHTIVIDCCGVKQRVAQPCFSIARQYGFTYVGGHPMAGTHFSGFKYSRSNLFHGAPMVLVPPRYDDMALLDTVKALLQPCGFGSFSVTTAEDHDRMIAFTSQMPHVISSAFIQSPTALGHKGFSAGSYKDLTRVARMNPKMWAELFLENRDFLLDELDTCLQTLTRFRHAIAGNDPDDLTRLLEQGNRAKEEADQ